MEETNLSIFPIISVQRTTYFDLITHHIGQGTNKSIINPFISLQRLTESVISPHHIRPWKNKCVVCSHHVTEDPPKLLLAHHINVTIIKVLLITIISVQGTT